MIHMKELKESLDFEILFENDNLLVINKPAGVMVHGDGRSDQETVADWFVSQYPESINVGEEPIETREGNVITRPGIVHRLDKDTSGAMILCKTDESHAHLKVQFQERTTQKTYRALVYGEMKKDSVLVDAPIGRSKTFAKWTAIPKAQRGKTRDAQTKITILDKFDGFSYVQAEPKTGRTHQIRVHLQYLNYPIVADFTYAGKRYDREKPQDSLGFTRQALHAYKIEFKGADGKEIQVTATLPHDFIQAGIKD